MAVILDPADELPTEAEIAAFEQEIGFRLPSAYRAFLRRYNGAKFPHLIVTAGDATEGEAFCYLVFPGRTKAPPARDDCFIVNSLYPLWRDPSRYEYPKRCDLRWVYKVSLEWSHPPELLPIGHDPGDRKCFLCLSGTRTGAVLLAGEAYLEKYNQNQFEAITSDDCRLLAESFEAFIDGLEWRAH